MAEADLTARQRLKFCAARLLCALPPQAQVLLSGRPPVCVDSQTLEPEMQLRLSLLERRGTPPLETLPPTEAHEAFRRRVAVSNGPPVPVGAVRDLLVDGAAGPLAALMFSWWSAARSHQSLRDDVAGRQNRLPIELSEEISRIRDELGGPDRRRKISAAKAREAKADQLLVGLQSLKRGGSTSPARSYLNRRSACT